ncbi:MAG: DUF5678 domain-containing protein [Patescibacteria group bacterium]|jgi:hypothetical protein
MKVIDQTKIYQDYKGQWVVLDSNQTTVLSADKKLSQALNKFEKKYGKRKVPLTFKVPEKILSYIGC